LSRQSSGSPLVITIINVISHRQPSPQLPVVTVIPRSSGAITIAFNGSTSHHQGNRPASPTFSANQLVITTVIPPINKAITLHSVISRVWVKFSITRLQQYRHYQYQCPVFISRAGSSLVSTIARARQRPTIGSFLHHHHLNNTRHHCQLPGAVAGHHRHWSHRLPPSARQLDHHSSTTVISHSTSSASSPSIFFHRHLRP